MPSSLLSVYPPLPSPVPPPLQSPASTDEPNLHRLPSAAAAPAGSSYGHSLVIIVCILGFVILACVSINVLLRLLSRPEPSTPPLAGHRATSASSPAMSDGERRVLTESLPVFCLPRSSSAAADCAVCLSRFLPGDELRYLPACRHAFHTSCIASWILSAPSCPLCRSPIHLPPPPPKQPPEEGDEEDEGKVMSGGGEPQPPPLTPQPPGEEVAEAVGSGRGGWLREFVDRLGSPASSVFSSRRSVGGDFESDGAASGRFGSASASASASYRWPSGAFP